MTRWSWLSAALVTGALATVGPIGGANPSAWAAPLQVVPGGEIEDREGEAPPLHFRPYRPNYLVVGSEDGEVRFQLSLMVPLLTAKRGGPLRSSSLAFAYTQTSFWEASSDSAPFRESDYNPELFFQWKPALQGSSNWSFKSFQAGLAHESNGRGGEDSRGWNVAYLESRFEYRRSGSERELLEIHLRAWPLTDLADENPDLLDFYGHGEIGMRLQWRWGQLALDSRFGKKFDRAGVLASLRLKLAHLSAFHLMIQAWSGYGESLLDYNVKDSNLRFGFVLAP